MKLSRWLPDSVELLKEAHKAWSPAMADWHELIMRRYGPRGTALFLFGKCNEEERKRIVVAVIADYLRSGRSLNFGSLDAFIQTAVKRAPDNEARDSRIYDKPEPEPPQYDDDVQTTGIRLLKEAVGVFPYCDCRRTGGKREPMREPGADCALDHTETDNTYQSIREHIQRMGNRR